MLILCFFVLILSFFLFRSASGSMSLNKLNIISVIFYYNLLVFAFFGSIIIYLGGASNPVLAHVSSDTREFGVMVIMYIMVAFPIGVILSRYIFSRASSSVIYRSYIDSSLVPSLSEKDSFIKLFLYGLSLISLLSVLYVTYIVGEIPQTNYFSSLTHSELLGIRVNNSRNFGGVVYIKTIFFEQLVPLLSLIAFAYYKMTGSKKDKLWFLLLFLASIYVKTFALSKSPLLVYFILFLFLNIYISGGVQLKKIFLIGIAGLTVLFGMFSIVAGGSFVSIFVYLLNRMFIDQVSGMYLMFEIFPSVYEHVGFNSLSRIIPEAFGWQYSEPATRLAMEYAFPVATAEGKMNLLSTLFIGEAWANFGWAGLILSPLYMGLVIGSFYYFILIRKKTPILVAVLTYCSFGVNFSSQFNQYIYNALLWIVLVGLFLSYLLGLMLKQSKASFSAKVNKKQS